MADLALMSWALWLLGHADTAIVRMDAAIQRADAISHPHSQAYACYYASILHALRGEFLTAQGHAERCIALSEEHGFRQWRAGARHSGHMRGVARSFTQRARGDPCGVGRISQRWISAGITALYVLLCPPLLIESRPRGRAGIDRAWPRYNQPQQRTNFRGRIVSAEGTGAARPRRTRRRSRGAGAARPGIEHGKKPTRQDA